MDTKIVYRITVDIILAISVLNGWWFIALPLVIGSVYVYSYFVEAVVAALAYDALFGFVAGMGTRSYIASITVIIACVVIGLLKKIVRK
jgi:hypothetical protein